ncbi:MAG TPA: hypothetical protein VF017_23325 [Thermoanaerobaculia bacterium]|nr:hypothetical protein [Thermoanaerobaculia bacterium]
MPKRALWIEDNAARKYQYWATRVYVDGRFDLSVAMNATDGMNRMNLSEFDAVVVDVRLPPGGGVEWIELYNRALRERREPHLGIEMLLRLFSASNSTSRNSAEYPSLGRADHANQRHNSPHWVEARRFAILTVESKFQDAILDCVRRTGVRHKEKAAGQSDTVLLDLLVEICEL